MAQNLAYLPKLNDLMNFREGFPSRDPFHQKTYFIYDYTGLHPFNAKMEENFHNYGALYNWNAAITSCPYGWNLPSNQDWRILRKYLGKNGAKKLKATSGWIRVGNGDNSSGFSALPGGCFNAFGPRFSRIGREACFWSDRPGDWWRVGFNSQRLRRYFQPISSGSSVRCVKVSEYISPNLKQ